MFGIAMKEDVFFSIKLNAPASLVLHVLSLGTWF